MRQALVKDWSGRRVAIIGAARQGIALAGYLARQGARVVLSDQKQSGELQSAQQTLAGLPIEWVLGGHPLNLLDGADLLCLSGGAPLSLPIVAEAQHRGIPLSNDSQVFLESAPCQVIGITGSAGKTTTTTLVGRMAQASIQAETPASTGQRYTFGSIPLYRKVWVGGNIGSPLIAGLEEVQAGDLAVMELSSFQLELMTVSPQMAAVLNLTPNHLDRHGSMAAYTAAKARILEFQSSEEVAVLGRDDPGAWGLGERVQGKLVSFGRGAPPEGQAGVYLGNDGQTIYLRSVTGAVQEDEAVLMTQEIPLRGEHNLNNVMAACAIASAAGMRVETLGIAVRDFSGVPHRLEFVRNWGGADWYNDSIATAPERAMAAIRSFEEPLILLAGGRDKDLPWEAFAEMVSQRVDHLVLFGEAAGKIERAIGPKRNGSRPEIILCKNLYGAVQVAAATVSPGDVVLLAPGGTSFDEFCDFEDRGEAYKKWVLELR
ncbi:MAG TPA: UDP-N-acetylmuramoyl-L-alanine--D-glutamate ligase [Anaerolineales bacterium]|nr:UDP-N-acetylmuramoyl-L-alanine--D-glutamate ligase [Anaerolineales bacterium]